MKISPQELEALQRVIRYADLFGYGNLISHLQSAWQRIVMNDGLSEETAKEAVMGREPYPLRMHQDIIEDGYWDETGERYRQLDLGKPQKEEKIGLKPVYVETLYELHRFMDSLKDLASHVGVHPMTDKGRRLESPLKCVAEVTDDRRVILKFGAVCDSAVEEE